MKILIIADEIWNDQIHGNNVLTNWFTGFPAEFAALCCSPGEPYNSICHSYFQITDKEMLFSFFSNKKAGKAFYGDFSENRKDITYNSTDISHLSFLRKYMGNTLRLFKTIVWNYGRIDEEKLRNFICRFKPDVIFSARFAHSKILRIEKLVKKYASCPIVAFTGDNEYSLRRFSLSPLFWVNLLYQRKVLRKTMPMYSLYYTLSERQIKEMSRHFDINMKILRKCSTETEGDFVQKTDSLPIRIVYAGKLYQGRDKTLMKLCDAIRKINSDSISFELHVYTTSNVSARVRKRLNDGRNCFLHEPVSSEKLRKIYYKADIALSVESFDLAYKLSTRVSFSTKIIDCLESTCAVMMIGWKENTGYEYLFDKNAAICIGNAKLIEEKLKEILSDLSILEEYRRNAYRCLLKYHRRKEVQECLYKDLIEVIGIGV